MSCEKVSWCRWRGGRKEKEKGGGMCHEMKDG